MGAFILATSQVFFAAGCRQTSGPGAGGNSGSTAAGSTGNRQGIGEIVYIVLHKHYVDDNKMAEAQALELRHDDFVDALNRIIPADFRTNIRPILETLFSLIDDGSLDTAAADMAVMIQDMLADRPVLDALATLLSQNANSGPKADSRASDILMSRLLGYREMDVLAESFMDLMDANDGVDAAGFPNGEPNLGHEIQAFVSRKLLAYSPAPNTPSQITQTLTDMADAMLSHQPLTAFPNLGDPAFATRLDSHGNPQVVSDTHTLPVPFVDNDGDGDADVNADGKPVDAAGSVIDIKPFGNDGNRDAFGRAIAPGGNLYYDYFDAKRTLLSEVLLLVGELVDKDVLGKTITVMNGLTDRVHHSNGTIDPSDDYVTLANDTPFLDLTYAQFELVKRTPLPQLLKGLGAVVEQDPARFANMVDNLLVAIKRASNAPTINVGTAIGGGPTLGNDLLPLLEAATQARGRNGVSAIRALLQAFNTEQRRLRTLPVTFARMMKYNDYRTQTPADATHKSIMQRVLDMMVAANQCSAPFIGNTAELYLKAMAGTERILGISISTSTIHRLMSVPFLRRLMCAGITESDVLALQDFDRTGALDAMKPIARAFADSDEIPLLKEIMLGLQRHYDTAMRPTEPHVVSILESGAVEKLFEVLDSLTQVRVPGSNMVVADALAETLQALLDSRTPILDRHGVAHRNLAYLLLDPMDTLSARATARNLDATFDALKTDLGDILLATYMDDAGTPQDPTDDIERWKWQGLSNSIGKLLKAVADEIPNSAADRAIWADDKQAEMVDLLAGRDVVFILDLLKTVALSPQSAVINRAISNLVTPSPVPQDDVFGALVGVLADAMLHDSTPAQPINTQALAEVLHFVGRMVDPIFHKMDGIFTMLKRLIRADDGLLLLKVARNAFDRGPNGTDESALSVIMEVFDEVKTAGGHTGPMTVAELEQKLRDMHDFLTDPVDGLPDMLDRVRRVRQ